MKKRTKKIRMAVVLKVKNQGYGTAGASNAIFTLILFR